MIKETINTSTRDTIFGQRQGEIPTRGKTFWNFFFYSIVIKCLVETTMSSIKKHPKKLTQRHSEMCSQHQPKSALICPTFDQLRTTMVNYQILALETNSMEEELCM